MAALGLIRTRVCRYWSGPKPHDNDAPGADAQYVSTSGRRDGNIDQVVTANARRKFGGLSAGTPTKSIRASHPGGASSFTM